MNKGIERNNHFNLKPWIHTLWAQMKLKANEHETRHQVNFTKTKV